mmetsp:Transcript_15676/g.39888  ORF Transcript_15676/g.39888 Transcript_15676/m.39888 type:complete len:301 (+) Transcript_15676:110-1012(+)
MPEGARLRRLRCLEAPPASPRRGGHTVLALLLALFLATVVRIIVVFDRVILILILVLALLLPLLEVGFLDEVQRGGDRANDIRDQVLGPAARLGRKERVDEEARFLPQQARRGIRVLSRCPGGLLPLELERPQEHQRGGFGGHLRRCAMAPLLPAIAVLLLETGEEAFKLLLGLSRGDVGPVEAGREQDVDRRATRLPALLHQLRRRRLRLVPRHLGPHAAKMAKALGHRREAAPRIARRRRRRGGPGLGIRGAVPAAIVAAAAGCGGVGSADVHEAPQDAAELRFFPPGHEELQLHLAK